jgi:nicotinate phosphoribosyltransferase
MGAGHLRAGVSGVAGADFRLSDFELSVEDGQISLRFDGLWTETTMWEIYALSAIDELKTRASLKQLSEFELDILYARAKTRLWEKMERLRGVPRLKRQRLWNAAAAQLFVAGVCGEGDERCAGRELRRQLEYLPGLQARSGGDRHQRARTADGAGCAGRRRRGAAAAQYRILELWQQSYQGELLILLPDTFGTTQFLEMRRSGWRNWTGQRIDSKIRTRRATSTSHGSRAWARSAAEAADRVGWAGCGADSGLHAYFGGRLRNGATPADFQKASDFEDERKWVPERRIRFSAGWGTFLTNDFRNCDPRGGKGFNPVSLVCKLTEVDGRPAVKLSDNYLKAMGPASEIERYRRVFGANVPLSA